MLIQGVGRGDFLGVFDVKNRGAFGGVLWGQKFKIYRKYIDAQRKFKFLTRGFPMCVIEYVHHHSAFTTTNAIIPRIISSSSSAHARTRARMHCMGLNLTTVIDMCLTKLTITYEMCPIEQVT